MMILVENTPGGLAINPLDVASVRVEQICGDTWLHILMRSGASYSRFHSPENGTDAHAIYKQILEAQ